MNSQLDMNSIAYALAKLLKDIYRQNIAYKVVLQVVKDSGFSYDSLDIDQLITDALSSEELKEEASMRTAFLDEWLPPNAEVDLDQVRKEFLERWKSDGSKPN